jgi:hypothetical protein
MTIKSVLATALILCGLATHAGVARADSLPIAQLQWLVGGTWVAQGANMPPDTSRIATQYRMAASGNFIQFTTEFLDKSGKPSGNYAGNLYFDPAAKSLVMWYMDRENVITQGPVATSPQGMTMTFTEDGASMGVSGPVDFQVVVTKMSENEYRWTLAARKGGSSASYKPLFSLDYARVAGTPRSLW